MKNLLRLAMFLPLALIYTTCPMKRQREGATESKKAKNNLVIINPGDAQTVNDYIAISQDLAQMSTTISGLQEDIGANMPIPLPNVTGKTMALIIKMLQFIADHGTIDLISYIKELVEPTDLEEFSNAAGYLDLKEIKAACEQLMQAPKQNTPQQKMIVQPTQKPPETIIPATQNNSSIPSLSEALARHYALQLSSGDVFTAFKNNKHNEILDGSRKLPLDLNKKVAQSMWHLGGIKHFLLACINLEPFKILHNEYGIVPNMCFSSDGKTLIWSDIKQCEKVTQYNIADDSSLKMSEAGLVETFQKDQIVTIKKLDDNGSVVTNLVDGSTMTTSSDLTNFEYYPPMCFSPNRGTFACGYKNVISFWNVADGEQKTIITNDLEDHDNKIITITFLSHDGTLLAATTENSIKIWNVNTGVCLRTIPIACDSYTLHSLRVSPDGETFAYVQNSGATSFVYLQKINDEKYSQCIKLERKKIVENLFTTVSCEFSPDGKTLAIMQDRVSILIWNYHNQDVNVINRKSEFISKIGFSHDGTLLFSSESDMIFIWNSADGNLLRTLVKPKSCSWSDNFCISPDGNILAFRCEDSNIDKLFATIDDYIKLIDLSPLQTILNKCNNLTIDEILLLQYVRERYIEYHNSSEKTPLLTHHRQLFCTNQEITTQKYTSGMSEPQDFGYDELKQLQQTYLQEMNHHFQQLFLKFLMGFDTNQAELSNDELEKNRFVVIYNNLDREIQGLVYQLVVGI